MKTSKSTESIIRPRKSEIGVSSDSSSDSSIDNGHDDEHLSCAEKNLSSQSSTSATPIIVKYNRVDNGDGCSGDFNKKFHLRLCTIAALLTSMLKTS